MDNKIEQTVYIIDDDADVRDSLTWLLDSVQLTSRTFATAQDFLDQYPEGSSGCIVMDVRMPGLSGISAQKVLLESGIHLPVIMISAHGNVDMAVTAMTQGALTFLEKPFDDQVLLDHIQSALNKDKLAKEADRKLESLRARFNTLTRREKQVFELVTAGHANHEIADRLAISRKTVEGHRAHMMKKLAANSLPNLMQIAIKLDG